MFNFDKNKLFQLRKALLKLGSIAAEEGTLVYDNDVLEVGMEVYVDGEDGLQPAPDKTYTYDGKTITVEGGVVTAIVENPIEQPAEETTEETTETETTEETEETPTEETEETTEEETTEETTETETEETEEETETTEETEETTEETVEEPSTDELKAVIEEQKAVIADLQAQIEELKKKLEEPAAQPADEEFKNQKPITTGNSKIDFSKYIKKNKN